MIRGSIMKLISIELSENLGPVGRFEIEIYNSEDQFYAGQTISGGLHVSLNKDVDCDLDIAVWGKVLVIFAPTVKKEIRVLTCRPDTEDYRVWYDTSMLVFGHAVFHKNHVIIWLEWRCMAENNSIPCPEKKLLAGSHHFEFTIDLPDSVLSSVTSPWVQVKFSADARLVDLNTRAVLAEASKPITIFDHHNLNLDPMNKTKVVSTFNGRMVPYWLSCLPCLLRSVPSVECHVPCRGFTPYSFIPIYISVVKEGPNTLQVNSINIQLVQTLTWQRLRRSFRICGTRMAGSEFGDRNEMWTLEHGLSVPLLPPSGHYEEYCSITIDYKICLSVRFHNKRRAINLTLPITIGTVPLAQNMGIDVPY